MKITIEYESSWRNSFLDGSNNEQIPKNGRKYVGSIQALKDKGENNYIKRTVSKDTVMGILNRLIGEQRKLYDVRQDKNYYLQDIEDTLTDIDIIDNTQLSNEVIYLRNISGNTDPSSFTGVIKLNDPWLSVNYAFRFWKILWFNLEELINFICDEKYSNDEVTPILDPLIILKRLEDVKKEKPVASYLALDKACGILQDKYPKFKLQKAGDKVSLLSIYCSSLYLQLDRLSEKFDTSEIRAPKGGLTGISHNGFTPKNIMERFTSGKQKIVWGNPYIKPDFINGEGKFNRILTKANGTLEINLNISEEQAKDLEQKILDAGVSSFYLGKKGLAYVTKIDTRENL